MDHKKGPKCDHCFLQSAREGKLISVFEHLSHGIDINTASEQGLRAIHLATTNGHVHVVQELLKRGAGIEDVTKEGYTPLHLACLVHNFEMVKFLLETGANINAKTKHCFTPLYIAAQENDTRTAELLLANGASQAILSKDAFTPLMIALQQGHDDMVALLLEHDPLAKQEIPALTSGTNVDAARALQIRNSYQRHLQRQKRHSKVQAGPKDYPVLNARRS